MVNLESLNNFNLGLGLRRGILDASLDFFLSENNSDLINWFEIVPENFLRLGGPKAAHFKQVLDTGVQLIPHGVNLSIATAGYYQKAQHDKDLIAAMHDLFEQIDPPWFSDHTSATNIGGYYLQELIPTPLIQESISVISDNVKWLQDEFQLPFLIENPSYYSTLVLPDEPSRISEAELINGVLEEADCGLLLDINNVYVNSVNHNYDPYKFLDELNLSRTVQVHIAGHRENFQGKYTNNLLKILDTHGEEIPEPVFKLFRYLVSQTESIKAVLLERDGNFPEDFSDLIAELERVKACMQAKEQASV